jgi:drug/metabolite transporter (DMT)-like permease
VGLYPVVMVLLGGLFLGERLTRIQATGASLAIAGVLLVGVKPARSSGVRRVAGV